jgi:uncharacterized protein (TIGR01732 family)
MSKEKESCKEKGSSFALLVVLFVLLIVVGSGFCGRHYGPGGYPGGFYGYEGELNPQYNMNPQYNTSSQYNTNPQYNMNTEFSNNPRNIRNPRFNNMPE